MAGRSQFHYSARCGVPSNQTAARFRDAKRSSTGVFMNARYNARYRVKTCMNHVIHGISAIDKDRQNTGILWNRKPCLYVDIVEVVGSSPISSTHIKTGFPTNSAETCFCLQPTESRLLAELSSAGQWFFCLEEAAAYSPRLQPGDCRRTESKAVKRRKRLPPFHGLDNPLPQTPG